MILNTAEISEEILQKGLEMAERVFETDSHPDQMQATPENFKKLSRLDPNSILYEVTETGEPIAWIVAMPTTQELGTRFVNKEITEQEFLDLTIPASEYDALYICAVATSPEHQRQGIATKLTLDAIKRLPLTQNYEVYSWPTSKEGKEGLKKFEKETGKVVHTRYE